MVFFLLIIVSSVMILTGCGKDYKKEISGYWKLTNIIYPYFTVLNIDKKGTPELIVAQDATCYWYNVYTIKNNKVKYAGCFGNQIYGSTIRYNKAQKGICGFWSGAGSMEEFFYTMSSGKLKTKCYILADNNHGKNRWFVNHKKCSQKTAMKYRTKYFKERNIVKYRCKKNTRSNRSRYIK